MIVHLSIACDCTNRLFSVCWQGRNTTLAANLVWDCGTGISSSLHDLHTVLDPWLCLVRARCFKSSKANNDLSIRFCCLLICLFIYVSVYKRIQEMKSWKNIQYFIVMGYLECGIGMFGVLRAFQELEKYILYCIPNQLYLKPLHRNNEIHRILCSIPGWWCLGMFHV